MKIHDDYKECRGCLSLRGYDYCDIGVYPMTNALVKCPCRFCIVKTMCNENCEDINNYMKLITEDQYEVYQ